MKHQLGLNAKRNYMDAEKVPFQLKRYISRSEHSEDMYISINFSGSNKRLSVNYNFKNILENY
jgi:hypothetical protein